MHRAKTAKIIKQHNDLTQGSVLKSILLFSLPIFIGNIFQQLYTLVDSLIVSYTLGEDAFTGVSITGSIVFLILGFAQGLTAGFCVATSQFFGAKDKDNVRKSIATSFILAAIFSVTLTIISVLLCEPLLQLLNTSDKFMPYAYDYIITIFWGMSASVFYNMVSNMLRALGDSRTPLYFLILASAINIGLDYLFILVFNSGVAGAALATVISQVISGLACLIFMFIKYPEVRLKKADFKTNFPFCWKHIRIGLPMGFQYSIIAIGIMVQQSAINALGDIQTKAHSTASKIDNLMTQPFIALGAAMATFSGQNYGAGKYKRIKEGIRKTMLSALVAMAIVTSIMWIFGRNLSLLFVPTLGEESLQLSSLYQRVQSSFYILLAMIYIYRNTLQGIGRSNITVIAGVLELGMRILAAFVFIRIWGFNGVCVSNPSAWVGAVIILLPAYYVAMHKLLKKQKVQESTDQSESTTQSEQSTTALDATNTDTINATTAEQTQNITATEHKQNKTKSKQNTKYTTTKKSQKTKTTRQSKG